MVARRFTKKMKEWFCFRCFSFFINVPEPAEAHTTKSTHTYPLHKPAWERYRPHKSSMCLRIVVERVCGMCASMTPCCCCCTTAEFRS